MLIGYDTVCKADMEGSGMFYMVEQVSVKQLMWCVWHFLGNTAARNASKSKITGVKQTPEHSFIHTT